MISSELNQEKLPPSKCTLIPTPPSNPLYMQTGFQYITLDLNSQSQTQTQRDTFLPSKDRGTLSLNYSLHFMQRRCSHLQISLKNPSFDIVLDSFKRKIAVFDPKMECGLKLHIAKITKAQSTTSNRPLPQSDVSVSADSCHS